jgi:RimJ/RimL family protein N-acetyltransferase
MATDTTVRDLPRTPGRLQHPCWKPFLEFTAFAAAGVALAVAYGAFLLGAVEALPSLVVATSYAWRIAIGYPHVDVAQANRLADAGNRIAPITMTIIAQTQVTGGVQLQRRTPPRVIVDSDFLRSLNDRALNGFAALIIAQLRDVRRASRTQWMSIALVAIAAVDAIVAFALTAPHGSAQALAVVGSAGFSFWLFTVLATAVMSPWSARAMRSSDRSAVALAGDVAPVAAALNSLAEWKATERRNAGVVARCIAWALQPIPPNAHEKNRGAALVLPELPIVTDQAPKSEVRKPGAGAAGGYRLRRRTSARPTRITSIRVISCTSESHSFETARLLIRTMRDKDLAAVLDIMDEPQARYWQGWTGLGREELVRLSRGGYEHGFTFFESLTVELRETHQVIGQRSYWQPTMANACMTGSTFAIDARGQGFGTEELKGTLEFLHRHMGYFSVGALTDESNAAARRQMEKSGMVYEGRGSPQPLSDGRVADPAAAYASVTGWPHRDCRRRPQLSAGQ